MVAKKLKKIQALAEVQKISLQSLQLVLPVREIYSGARSQSADMASSRYSSWVYFTKNGKLMTARQKAGEAPSQSLNVQASTTRVDVGIGSSDLDFMCNSPLRCLVLQLLPSSGAASRDSLSPHCVAFPEYLLKEVKDKQRHCYPVMYCNSHKNVELWAQFFKENL